MQSGVSVGGTGAGEGGVRLYLSGAMKVNLMGQLDAVRCVCEGRGQVRAGFRLYLVFWSHSFIPAIDGLPHTRRSGKLQDEDKAASSQVLCLKEAVHFTAR